VAPKIHHSGHSFGGKKTPEINARPGGFPYLWHLETRPSQSQNLPKLSVSHVAITFGPTDYHGLGSRLGSLPPLSNSLFATCLEI